MQSSEQFYIEIRKKWKSIYPAYFDKSKTITEGRRVPQKFAVEDPTLPEVLAAISFLNIRFLVEQHKAYPKDWMNKGRVKIELLDDNKKPTNPKIKNKNQLLKAIGANLVTYRSTNITKPQKK